MPDNRTRSITILVNDYSYTAFEGALLLDSRDRDVLLASMRKLASDSTLRAQLNRPASADAQLYSCDHARAKSLPRLLEAA